MGHGIQGQSPHVLGGSITALLGCPCVSRLMHANRKKHRDEVGENGQKKLDDVDLHESKLNHSEGLRLLPQRCARLPH
jgi:hypothetical protein